MDGIENERTFTAFAGHKRVVSGDAKEMIAGVKRHLERRPAEDVLVFEDRTGRQVDFDLRGTVEEAVERLSEHPLFAEDREKEKARTGPGRPKLGVTSREVSLLPRHWEWLEGQSGGASAALRRLVEEARKKGRTAALAKAAREAAGRFLWTMAGNLPGFEEASRALYARDDEKLSRQIRKWPKDVREHVERLAAEAARLEKAAAQEQAASPDAAPSG